MFFMVFKSPAEGRTHIFRSNEPFAQFTLIPEECDFELVKMSEEEAAERELQARRIHESRAGTQWTSASDAAFDATYRRIHGAARKFQPR